MPRGGVDRLVHISSFPEHSKFPSESSYTPRSRPPKVSRPEQRGEHLSGEHFSARHPFAPSHRELGAHIGFELYYSLKSAKSGGSRSAPQQGGWQRGPRHATTAQCDDGEDAPLAFPLMECAFQGKGPFCMRKPHTSNHTSEKGSFISPNWLCVPGGTPGPPRGSTCKVMVL